MDITCKHGVPLYGFTACGNCEEDRWQEKHRQPPHPAPTLTCSEVVERLQRECFNSEINVGERMCSGAWFDRTKAEAILHEWRERRVQELEELIAKHSISLNSADSASRTEGSSTAKETRKDSLELAKKICREIYGDESLSAITIIADTIDYIERRTASELQNL